LSTASTDILGHPRGLVILFFTEMWERFSFYGMKALLIFYLTRQLMFGQGEALLILGSYLALVYVTPVLGGYIADRYLGFRRAIWFGGILIMCGHLGLALEGVEASISPDGTVSRNEIALQAFYFSLALIVAGTGLLKSSISSIVGSLYEETDPRRDGGFSIFYMGINFGAFIAPLLCGWLGETYGWSWGFGAAAVGMLAGLMVFKAGAAWLDGRGEPANIEALNQTVSGPLKRGHCVYIGCLAAVLPFWLLVQSGEIVGTLLTIVGLCLVVVVIVYAVRALESVDRDRVFAILALLPASTIFWMFFEQTGGSIALFAEKGVDLNVLGIQFLPSQIQSINPLMIITLAPVFGWLWVALQKRGRDISLPVKFSLGLVQLGIGFYMLFLGVSSATANEPVALIWLVLAYLFHTTGELTLSPIGLSAVTKLSIDKILGLMMGIWFLANGFANYFASRVAIAAGLDAKPGEAATLEESLPVFGNLFESIAFAAVVAGVVMFIVSPFIRRLMHGVK